MYTHIHYRCVRRIMLNLPTIENMRMLMCIHACAKYIDSFKIEIHNMIIRICITYNIIHIPCKTCGPSSSSAEIEQLSKVPGEKNKRSGAPWTSGAAGFRQPREES